MMNTTMKKLVSAAGLVIGGLILGWLLFSGSNSSAENGGQGEHAHESGHATIWTCSMHPQIRQGEPGLCPICAMDLIPLEAGDTNAAPDMIEMTEAAVALANVQTSPVTRGAVKKEILLNGKIVPDERNIAEITARFGGRIEQLYVNFTGQEVKKGERLASIYSPALVAAQQELLEAMKLKQSSPALYNAARNKLALWDISDEQIARIEEGGKPITNFEVRSPMSGTVLGRHVDRGDYVSEGKPMFEVASLQRIWVMFEAYESDLPWIRKGSVVSFTVQSMPGKTFQSSVAFVDPVVDAARRVAYVRSELNNPGGALKPGMFARGTLRASIGAGSNDLLVPKSAVLWTGERSVVYVKDESADMPRFGYREVVLGPETGDAYVVESGIAEGELLVTNGVFAIDAAAQLQGKTSMMNSEHGTGKGGMTMADMPESFTATLAPVYKSYLALKDAFVGTNAQSAQKAAKALVSAVRDVNAAALTGDHKSHWNGMKAKLLEQAEVIAKSSEVERQRAAFSPLSDAMYKTAKHFGGAVETLYYQHCPMAFDNTGASWLSAQKQIANPYFGEKMMKCGTTEETLAMK